MIKNHIGGDHVQLYGTITEVDPFIEAGAVTGCNGVVSMAGFGALVVPWL